MDPEPEAVTSKSTPNGITTILINRQHRRNAVDPSTAKKLYQKILDFENDSSQKVCILSGENGTFCAGADLHEVAGMQQPQSERENLRPVNGRNLAPMGPSRLQVKKPIIAAVCGFAVAGGLELSFIADMRVVEEDAVFGVFCRRWGVPLIDGGTVILTGRPVDAKEALAIGLANRVVLKGKALEEAEKIANQLLAFPQLCMNTDRNSCYYSAYNASSFEDAMRTSLRVGLKLLVWRVSIKGAALFKAGKGRHGKSDEPSKL
jgi:enoyl-CoA hydratase/carnithine racemase